MPNNNDELMTVFKYFMILKVKNLTHTISIYTNKPKYCNLQLFEAAHAINAMMCLACDWPVI